MIKSIENKTIVACIVFLLLFFPVFHVSQYDESVVRFMIKPKIECSYSTVWSELSIQTLHHKEVVFQQILLESNYLKSSLFKKTNNFLGLTTASKDTSEYYKVGKYKYRKYKRWELCISDYKDKIQSKYKKGEEYYKFLIRIGYAEDSIYIYKLKAIKVDLYI